MKFQELRYNVRDHVATITFDRPQRRNAWTPVLEHELRAAIALASSTEEVRAIVLTGAGDAFCVGADVAALAGGAETAARLRPPSPPSDDDLAQRYSYLLAVEKPLLAGINGAAAGIGLCLTLFCDIRYIAAGAKLSAPYARRGLVAEHGSAWLLSRLVGPMNAADLLLSGRVVAAQEAAGMGLAKLRPAENFADQVQERASEIANRCSPRAVRIIKWQLRVAGSQSLAQATQLADTELESCLGTADFREGVAHFVEKREPNFPGY
jgi:enoyl-CoA hydratase/carnithine racemase